MAEMTQRSIPAARRAFLALFHYLIGSFGKSRTVHESSQDLTARADAYSFASWSLLRVGCCGAGMYENQFCLSGRLVAIVRSDSVCIGNPAMSERGRAIVPYGNLPNVNHEAECSQPFNFVVLSL